MIRDFILGKMSIYRSFLLFITAFLLLYTIPYRLLDSYLDHYFSEICPQLLDPVDTILNSAKVITEDMKDCEPIALWADIIDSEVFVISTSLVFALVAIGALLSAFNNIKTRSHNVVSRILAGCMGIVIVFLSFTVLESSVYLLFFSPDIAGLDGLFDKSS